MLAVLSPAKSLDLAPARKRLPEPTQPELLDEAVTLVEVLRRKSPKQLAKLMNLSDALAELNAERFCEFTVPFTPDNAKPAVLMFAGDVYQGLDAGSWRKADYAFAQHHLRILSGLFGLLRPLDLIQPYRLEMGTRLKTRRGSTLYEFWGDRITHVLNDALRQEGSGYLVNLASNEYFRAIRKKQLDASIVTPAFRDLRKGKYVIISFFAKQARGMMARYIVRQRLKKPEQLLDFDMAGYRFNAALSSVDAPVFTRDEPPAGPNATPG